MLALGLIVAVFVVLPGWRMRRDAVSRAASQHSEAEAWATLQRDAQRGPGL